MVRGCGCLDFLRGYEQGSKRRDDIAWSNQYSTISTRWQGMPMIFSIIAKMISLLPYYLHSPDMGFTYIAGSVRPRSAKTMVCRRVKFRWPCCCRKVTTALEHSAEMRKERYQLSLSTEQFGAAFCFWFDTNGQQRFLSNRTHTVPRSSHLVTCLVSRSLSQKMESGQTII
jgi:hypothetical protein